MTKGFAVNQGKGLTCVQVTIELNMSRCYINDITILTWLSTTTNSTMCSINPAFDHWGTLATVQSSRVLCSFSFPPPSASVTSLMTRLFGLIRSFSHSTKYSFLWVSQSLISSIISYWHWVLASSYLTISIQHVEMLPANQILHSRHFHAATLLSGCSPSSNTASRSAVWMSPPLLEHILVLLRAYTHPESSQRSPG